jgi:hypothetical protein
MQEIVGYGHRHDWRKAETAINAYEHYRVEAEGVPVHFMRKPGAPPAATSAPWSPGCSGTSTPDELYAIHIGSGLKLTLFNGGRAWDLSGGRPIKIP